MPAFRRRTPALFSGDMLFNAGAGNCHGGGHPEELYDTFVSLLAELSEDTQVYRVHDYITNNLVSLSIASRTTTAAALLGISKPATIPTAPW